MSCNANYLRAWRERNPVKVRKYAREQGRRQRAELRPAYLKRQLAARVRPQTMGQLKQRIQIRRSQPLFRMLAAAGQIKRAL